MKFITLHNKVGPVVLSVERIAAVEPSVLDWGKSLVFLTNHDEYDVVETVDEVAALLNGDQPKPLTLADLKVKALESLVKYSNHQDDSLYNAGCEDTLHWVLKIIDGKE